MERRWGGSREEESKVQEGSREEGSRMEERRGPGSMEGGPAGPGVGRMFFRK